MIQTIFLQNNTIFKPLHKKEKVNIILSPSFYWVKLFTIPVDTIDKALFLLPNLFEDYFDIAGYSFYTTKVGENQYLSFAYDEDKIIQKLKEISIPQSKILNIYFAQNEFKDIATVEEQKSFRCGDEVFVYEKELLVKIPNHLVIETNIDEINISKINLSLHCIQLFSYKKLTSNKTGYLASSILLGFSILLFVQTFLFQQLASEYPIKSEILKKEYSLPTTTLEANAIVTEYQKIQRGYKEIRDAISYLIDANKVDRGTINGLSLEKNLLTVSYQNGDIEKLEPYIKQKFRKSTIKSEDGKIKVRIEL